MMSKQFYKEELGKMIAENSELRDHSCHAETDGYEVGSPSDYEEDRQLKLFNEI